MTNALTYRGPSLRALHEDYAKQGRVDDRAPVLAHREAVVRAPVDRVWAVLIDIPSWGRTLEPGVKNIRLERGIAVDAPFLRSNSGARMKARFAVVRPERELAWTGSSLGARAVHRIELTPLGPEATRVTVAESMSASLLAGPLLAAVLTSAKLDALLASSLTALSIASTAAAGT